jgi:formylglycine-generating enzyme required for sulfatase activity
MNGTTVICAMLALEGVLADVKVAEPSAESAMKDMRLIAGGTSEMGEVFDEGVRFATPVHEVTVSDFYLNAYEVTVEEFAAFANETVYVTSAERGDNREPGPGKIPMPRTPAEYNARLAGSGAIILDPVAQETSWGLTANWRNPLYEQGPRGPVVCVSWTDAVHYCNWPGKKEGLPVAYDVKTGDLLDSQGQSTADITKVRGYRLPSEVEWEYAA